jgi:hypothetical protein
LNPRPRVTSRRIIAANLFFLALSLSSAASPDSSTTLLPLDGFNKVLFNQEYPERSLNLFSTVYGSPLDSFPYQHLPLFYSAEQSAANGLSGLNSASSRSLVPSFPRSLDSTSPARLTTLATLGAETGDALLNRVDHPLLANRDHHTLYEGAYSVPSRGITLFSGYRYIDHYSDRYDSLWARYSRARFLRPRFQSEGLAFEGAAGMVWHGRTMASTSFLSSYGYWGATPFFFSPLYKKGYRLSQAFDFTVADVAFHGQLVYDRHKDYFDYQTSTSNEDWHIALNSRKQLTTGMSREFFFQFDSPLDPMVKAGASLHDTLQAAPLNWHAQGGLYSNFRPFAKINAQYQPASRLLVDVESGWEYHQKERGYTFPEKLMTVAYVPTGYEALSLHAALRYSDTLLFPLKASLWYDYCSAPLWERLSDFDQDTMYIRQDTIAGAARHHVGGKASYAVRFGRFAADLWGNAALTPPKKKYRFSLPRVLGADLGYGSPQSDSLYAGVRIEALDRQQMLFWNDDRQIYEGHFNAAQTRCSFVVKLPVLLPLWREDLRLRCWVKAGPFYLGGEGSRRKQFAKGNLIGPAVALSFDGMIR